VYIEESKLRDVPGFNFRGNIPHFLEITRKEYKDCELTIFAQTHL
jgi:hypothetical protein